MEYLTGNIQFTKEEIVFESEIKEWKDKDIIYEYQGFGGNMFIDFIFDHSNGDCKLKDVVNVYPKMMWEEKQYPARIVEVNKNKMTIELKENGYRFYIMASDFRNDKFKYKFDILG